MGEAVVLLQGDGDLTKVCVADVAVVEMEALERSIGRRKIGAQRRPPWLRGAHTTPRLVAQRVVTEVERDKGLWGGGGGVRGGGEGRNVIWRPYSCKVNP